MLDTKLNEKTILITGATSGIGKTMLNQFVSQGANVVAVGRNEEKLIDLQEKYSKSVYTLRYDFMDIENIENIFRFCKENELKLDGLIHCAGVCFNGSIKANIIEQMEMMMRVNCLSLFELGKFFSMKKYSKDGAVLIAVSSLAALANTKGLAQYSASKAAVDSVVKSMAKEFTKRKLRVNAILPANVCTPMFLRGIDEIENYMETCESRQPLGTIEPEQIAYMAEFLLSENAKYMTGELVTISGGSEY